MSGIGKRVMSGRATVNRPVAAKGNKHVATGNPVSVARYIPLVAAAGLAGLAVSLFLLTAHTGFLLHMLTGVLK